MILRLDCKYATVSGEQVLTSIPLKAGPENVYNAGFFSLGVRLEGSNSKSNQYFLSIVVSSRKTCEDVKIGNNRPKGGS